MCVARGLGSQRNLIDAGKEVLLQAERRELKMRMKEQWRDLTHDDLDAIDGTREQLLGLLQRRYGYTRERAEDECKRVAECWSPNHQLSRSEAPLTETHSRSS